MEYNINLGVWQSVFAVPSEIVDQHIKLAGAAQLKVILWFLRHAGESFTVDDIAQSLSMQSADVRDCMQYWVQTGVIAVNENMIEPVKRSFAEAIDRAGQTDTNESAVMTETQEAQKEEPVPSVSPEPTPKRIMTRPEKPDHKYLAQRIANDKSIEYLMQSADEIFGRMTSNNDKATLLFIHEYDGLPVEVIIMLLQYACSIGKCNMRYIEKMAISWADEEITTLEAADMKIQKLTSGRNAAKIVQRVIGLDEHSPTEKETIFADRWLNQWKFHSDMIRQAYEICVDSKGKYVQNYVNRILERWYHSGITTVEQVEQEKEAKKPKKKETYGATYDISEYESSSVIDEEW